MEYQNGFLAGQEDYDAGNSPRSNRADSVEYRNGYSDGYWRASGGELLW